MSPTLFKYLGISPKIDQSSEDPTQLTISFARKRDGELGWVFRRLVDFGADPEILEEGWAHLGTDKIRQILPNLRNRIIDLGGEVRFDALVSGLIVEGGNCVGVTVNGQVERSDITVMATGHSASRMTSSHHCNV